MMSVCTKCGKEYYTMNYKHKLCPKCYDLELEKAVKRLKEEWGIKALKINGKTR